MVRCSATPRDSALWRVSNFTNQVWLFRGLKQLKGLGFVIPTSDKVLNCGRGDGIVKITSRAKAFFYWINIPEWRVRNDEAYGCWQNTSNVNAGIKSKPDNFHL